MEEPSASEGAAAIPTVHQSDSAGAVASGTTIEKSTLNSAPGINVTGKPKCDGNISGTEIQERHTLSNVSSRKSSTEHVDGVQEGAKVEIDDNEPPPLLESDLKLKDVCELPVLLDTAKDKISSQVFSLEVAPDLTKDSAGGISAPLPCPTQNGHERRLNENTTWQQPSTSTVEEMDCDMNSASASHHDLGETADKNDLKTEGYEPSLLDLQNSLDSYGKGDDINEYLSQEIHKEIANMRQLLSRSKLHSQRVSSICGLEKVADHLSLDERSTIGNTTYGDYSAHPKIAWGETPPSGNAKNYINGPGDNHENYQPQGEADDCSSYGSNDSYVFGLDDLPVEIRLEILNYFQPRELCQYVAPVCKRWYQYAYNPDLWKKLDFEFNESILSCHLCWCVSKAPGLRSLRLFGRDNLSVTEMEFIAETCPMLQELDLGFCENVHTQILGVLRKKCKNIEILNIEGCNKVDDFCVKQIVYLDKLRELNMSHCTQVGDEGIVALARWAKKLQKLDIDGLAYITDVAIEELASKRGATLTHLVLDGAELTDSAIQAISSSCSELQQLSLSYAELLTDETLFFLQNMTQLRQLRLKKAGFTTEGMQQFFLSGNLSKLTSLNLTECSQLDDQGVINIARSCGKSLQQLTLCWCWLVTDVGLISIVDNCSNLQHLDLLGLDKIRGDCLDRIPDELPLLTFLDLRQCNRIQDDLVLEMIHRKRDLTVINYYGEELVAGNNNP